MRGASLVFLAGCDILFQLQHVPEDCDSRDGDPANEDGDEWTDRCDLCPAIAETQALDSDDDGVGDACDPHPDQSGDSIVLFEGFAHGIPNDWEQRGTWRAMDGAVEVTSEGHAKEYLLPPTSNVHPTVSAFVTAMPQPHDYDWKAGVTAALRDMPGLAMSVCVFGRSFQSQDVLQLYQVPTGTSPRVPFMIYQPTTLTVERDGMNLICAGRNAAGSSQVTDTVATLPVRVGLALDSADATVVRFDWLMVVETN